MVILGQVPNLLSVYIMNKSQIRAVTGRCFSKTTKRTSLEYGIMVSKMFLMYKKKRLLKNEAFKQIN